MKKTLFLQILVIWLFLGVLALEKLPQAELKLVSSFPSQEIFFRTFPIIDVDNDGCIYAVDNREHIVFKFNKYGDLLFKFGGWGQGPGELQWPSKIAVDQKTGEIIIKDNNGIEVFDAKGNFVPQNVPQLRSIISTRRCQPPEVTLTTQFKDRDYSRFVDQYRGNQVARENH